MDFDEKKEPSLVVGGIDTESASSEEQEKYGTVNDKGDMHRLGKLQQLRVSLLDTVREWFANIAWE
jgi:hypothetical protein